MIPRVILVIEDEQIQKQLVDLLSREDVLVGSIHDRHRLWERLSNENCDLIVVDRRILPDLPSGIVRILSRLPESPGVVVLRDGDNPKEDAQLLAAGCTAVLHAGLPPSELGKPL